MSDIVDFRKKAYEKEDLIWMCSCGNGCFYLHENGDLECTVCNKMQDGLNQYKTIRKWTKVEYIDE